MELVKYDPHHSRLQHWWARSKSWLNIHQKLIVGHIVFWISCGLFLNGILLDIYDLSWSVWYKSMLTLGVNAVVFYTSAFLIAPRYLKKSHPIQGIYAILLIIGAGLTSFLLQQNNYEKFIRDQLDFQEWSFFMIQSLQPICFFVFGVTYALALDWIKNIRLKSELKNKQLETELKLLKSQIQPHFLFNTLNNIYTLCYVKDEKAAPMVLNLSKMLRYILYEGEKDKVSLQSEITFLHTLVELQELKNSEEQSIVLQCENVRGTYEIAPLLLLNFFENAFKHGDWNSNPKAWMEANIEINKANQLHFSLQNSTNRHKNQYNNQKKGIGLENVRRRLALLYPYKHKLHVQQSENKDVFTVELSINL